MTRSLVVCVFYHCCWLIEWRWFVLIVSNNLLSRVRILNAENVNSFQTKTHARQDDKKTTKTNKTAVSLARARFRSFLTSAIQNRNRQLRIFWWWKKKWICFHSFSEDSDFFCSSKLFQKFWAFSVHSNE